MDQFRTLGKRRLLLVLLLPLLLGGCSYLNYLNPFSWFGSEPEAAKKVVQRPDLDESTEIKRRLHKIRRIFVQSFTGENLKPVRDMMFAVLRENSNVEFTEVLPDDLEGLGVLRVKVTDFSIWESSEDVDLAELAKIWGDKKGFDKVLRRNALVAVRLSLFEAETGTALVRGNFSQPFQQIYIGEDQIKDRPKEQEELRRLSRILSYKILDAFLPVKKQARGLDLEEGVGYGWLAEHIHDFGSSRLKKGNDLASVGDYNNALWVWRIILYGPDEGEPEAAYQVNRASAFYNLGQIYRQQGDYIFAAKMFSQANRLKQNLKYAQAWGDAIHTWLLLKKDINKDEEMVILDHKTAQVVLEEEKPKIIPTLEKNPALLLKAKQLWPLEPLVTNSSADKLESNPGLMDPEQKTKIQMQRQEYEFMPLPSTPLILPPDESQEGSGTAMMPLPPAPQAEGEMPPKGAMPPGPGMGPRPPISGPQATPPEIKPVELKPMELKN